MKELSQEEMTTGHLRNIQQIAVFRTGNNEIYAINIAKIKAFVIKEDVKINLTPKTNEFIKGIATIRGEPITIIDLDKWLYSKSLDFEVYNLFLYCDFNNIKISFPIKDMIDIVEKSTNELINNEEKNIKTSYVTYIKEEGQEKLCTVFNAEQLLKDSDLISEKLTNIKKIITKKINNKKKLLVAEDSSVARSILKNIFSVALTDYEIFNNGEELLNYINNYKNPSENIGFIITDIEMPKIDGYQVVKELKGNIKTKEIPICVNSSMTSDAILQKMEALSANHVLAKTNVAEIYKLLLKYLDN